MWWQGVVVKYRNVVQRCGGYTIQLMREWCKTEDLLDILVSDTDLETKKERCRCQ
jgi:hypothetical protein